MLFRTELTYNEVENILDMKNIDTSTTGYTFAVGLNEISYINLKSSPADDPKVHNTIDDIRVESNLASNKKINFTKKSFFYTILGLLSLIQDY